MTAIVYPAGLPRMQLWPTVARERRAVSGGEGIKAAPRARSRDRIADIDAQWFYKPAHMAVWSPWYEDTLLNGTRWFAINAPGPGGWQQRVCRFRTATVRREALPGGHWRVTAQLEQRGRSQVPQAALSRFASGLGFNPALPSTAGHALILGVLHKSAMTLDTPAAWQAMSTGTFDSSGTVQLSLFGRVADGSADDAAMSFASAEQAAWFVCSTPVADVDFPAGMGPYIDTAVSVDPPAIAKPAGDHLALAIAFVTVGNTPPGTADITAPPAGYETVADQTYTLIIGLGTQTPRLVVARREFSGTSENPGAFDEGSGTYGNGGSASATLVLRMR
jgi:hypothetical protein